MLSRLLALAIRLLAATWRVRRDPWPEPGGCVLALWHGEQLPMIALHRGMGIVGVASRSRDGAWVADTLRHLGFGVVRGSSSAGGGEAILACREALRRGERPALAVDGPRGPRGRVAGGAEALARAAGVPVVYGRVEAAGWRARSWDQFLVPWPFARVVVRYGVWRPGGEGGELAERSLADSFRGALPPSGPPLDDGVRA